MKQKLLLFSLMLVSCIVSMYADGYVPDMTKAMSITVNDLDQTKFTTKGTPYTVTSAVVDGKSFTATFNNETAGGWTTSRNDYVANPEGKAINFNIRGQLKKHTTVSLQFPCKGYLYVYGYSTNSTLTLSTGKIDNQTISVGSTKEKIPTVEDASTTVNAYVTQKFIALKGNATLCVDNQNSIYFYGFCFVPDESIEFETKPYAAYKDGTLTFRYDNKWGEAEGSVYVVGSNSNGIRTWDEIAATTTSVVFAPSFAQCTEITSTYAWFGGFTSLKSITGLENLNTQNVTTMYNMFYNCSSLTSLDVSNFNTKNVTNMSGMFAGCSGLTSLDVSHFNTENVTNMSGMFANCSSLTSIDITNFDPRNVTTMSDMFYGCSSLTALNIVFPSWAGKLLSTSGMFAYCSSLTSLSVKVDTEKVTNMSGMFYGCSGLTSIDVSQFNTENVTNMTSMFYGCTGLSILDLRNFSIKKLTDATDLYAACSEDLVVYLPEGWNADKVTRTASLVPIGDYLYNIYNDKHAVLAYLNRPVTIAGDVVVPSKVTYQGEECKVTKVSRMSFAESTSEKNLYTYLTDEEYAQVSSITFEEGIEEIDCRDIAYFSHCNSINIPKSVKYISPVTYQLYGSNRSYTDYSGARSNNITFNVDTENSVYCSVDGVLYDKDMKTLLRCPRNKADVFTVPETVETIGDLAFANCEQLTFVELPKGLKSIGTPEEPTSYFDGVFQRCYGLQEINIPAGVKYIGTKAFYGCTYLEKITSYIKNPEGYNDASRFSSQVYDKAALYVPFGTGEKYRDAAGWNNFYIIEMDPELDPIEEATTIAFEGSDFVSANETPVDLNNTVVNDTYFSINNNANTDGYYDATEQCIVISKATSSEAMQTVVANALGSADFISNYTGMVIEVNGKGSITISAQTLGSNRLAVKIGSADAKTFAQTEKGDVTVNYDVTGNAYVYIYAVDADNQQQSLSMDVTASENAVKVYSITVTPSVTAIESVAANSSDAVFGKIYSIDGKQLSAPQKGLNILRMSDGTTRKIVR